MKPKIVGYWAVEVTPQMDLIKYGKGGDVVFPYSRPSQAVKQCQALMEHSISSFYLLRVFDNGQMKTFEVDCA